MFFTLLDFYFSFYLIYLFYFTFYFTLIYFVFIFILQTTDSDADFDYDFDFEVDYPDFDIMPEPEHITASPANTVTEVPEVPEVPEVTTTTLKPEATTSSTSTSTSTELPQSSSELPEFTTQQPTRESGTSATKENKSVVEEFDPEFPPPQWTATVEAIPVKNKSKPSNRLPVFRVDWAGSWLAFALSFFFFLIGVVMFLAALAVLGCAVYNLD